MKILENVDLSKYSYMKIGGTGKYLIEIEKDREIKDAHDFAREKNLPIFSIGSGSNTIFSDKDHNMVFIKFKTKDIIKTYEDENFINLKVSAGVDWDDFVAWAVSHGYSGIECLSLIPGTVGAAPIQNIGAYGQEVKDSILNVEVYEFETGNFYEIPNLECDFSYRDSIFKKNIGKFVVVNVGFRLSKKEPKMPTYKDLSLYFLTQQTKNPSLKKIRQAVIEIRKQKLPDWQKEPNCGSFFKNPIISNDLAQKLIKKYPDLPQYNAGIGKTKISGGWLIEKCGLKGKSFDGISVHDKSA
ncbi:MAG: UDP-N-acetylmuramate dehydrogenase, partial [Bacteriovoracia bacterium]